MRVDVQSLQFIPPRCQWIDKALLLEAVAQFRPPGVVRLRGEMIEALRDAAEFDCEYLLHVRFCLRRRPLVRPSGHTFEYLERLFIPGQSVHVKHASCDLVNRVERSPNPLAFVEPIPPCRRKRAKVLAAKLFLTLSHLSDHVIALGFSLLIPQRATGGKEVAAKMSAQFARALTILRLLPTSEWFRRPHRQSGIGAERIQEAVRPQSGHVAAVPLLRVEVDIVRQQPNLIHFERLYPRYNISTSEL